MLRQQRSAERLRRFDRAMMCGYGLLASILVVRLVFGGVAFSPEGAQTGEPLGHAPHLKKAAAF